MRTCWWQMYKTRQLLANLRTKAVESHLSPSAMSGGGPSDSRICTMDAVSPGSLRSVWSAVTLWAYFPLSSGLRWGLLHSFTATLQFGNKFPVMLRSDFSLAVCFGWGGNWWLGWGTNLPAFLPAPGHWVRSQLLLVPGRCQPVQKREYSPVTAQKCAFTSNYLLWWVYLKKKMFLNQFFKAGLQGHVWVIPTFICSAHPHSVQKARMKPLMKCCVPPDCRGSWRALWPLPVSDQQPGTAL